MDLRNDLTSQFRNTEGDNSYFEHIPVEYFGRDHYEILLYIDFREHDYAGRLNALDLRLRDVVGKSNNPTRTILKHADYVFYHTDHNIIEDLMAAGFVKKIEQRRTPTGYLLTDEGKRVVSELNTMLLNRDRVTTTRRDIFDAYTPFPVFIEQEMADMPIDVEGLGIQPVTIEYEGQVISGESLDISSALTPHKSKKRSKTPIDNNSE